MSEQDLALGLAALEDDEVRAKVADGDLSAAGDLDLTEEEQALLRAAADDEAEVVGFGINTSLGDLGTASWKVHKGEDLTVNRAKTADKNFNTWDKFLRS